MKTQSRHILTILIALLLLAGLAAAAQAQESEYRLNLRRDFGYGAGSQIRGNFTVEVIGPAGIQTATFLMDGKVMQEVTSPPFKHSFKTQTYANGWHELSAVVKTVEGKTHTTPVRRLEFVGAEQESQAITNILLPLLGVILAATLVGLVSQFVIGRGKPRTALPPGAPRRYGLKGGAICPHCDRPFGVHIWSLNLLAGVYDRCDHCGKWSLVRRASPEMLRTAELAEVARARQDSSAPAPAKSEDEKLREMLDDSKYTSE